MNKRVAFIPEAWEDYLYWQAQDKKTLKRISQVLRDIQRSSFEGIGKPEPLKNNKSGLWSRRIDGVNRVVYRIMDTFVEIVQCRGHYSVK